jgi:hypothetical protein
MDRIVVVFVRAAANILNDERLCDRLLFEGFFVEAASFSGLVG